MDKMPELEKLQVAGTALVQTLINTVGVEKTTAFLEALTPLISNNPEKVRAMVSKGFQSDFDALMKTKGQLQAVAKIGSMIAKIKNAK